MCGLGYVRWLCAIWWVVFYWSMEVFVRFLFRVNPRVISCRTNVHQWFSLQIFQWHVQFAWIKIFFFWIFIWKMFDWCFDIDSNRFCMQIRKLFKISKCYEKFCSTMGNFDVVKGGKFPFRLHNHLKRNKMTVLCILIPQLGFSTSVSDLKHTNIINHSKVESVRIQNPNRKFHFFHRKKDDFLLNRSFFADVLYGHFENRSSSHRPVQGRWRSGLDQIRLAFACCKIESAHGGRVPRVLSSPKINRTKLKWRNPTICFVVDCATRSIYPIQGEAPWRTQFSIRLT